MWSSFQMKQLTGLLKGIHCLINKKNVYICFRAKRGGLTQVLGDRLHVAPGGADLFNMLRPGYEVR